MTGNLEEKKEPLNNQEPQINKGFELLLWITHYYEFVLNQLQIYDDT